MGQLKCGFLGKRGGLWFQCCRFGKYVVCGQMFDYGFCRNRQSLYKNARIFLYNTYASRCGFSKVLSESDG
jgi:hypothetical protein